MKKNKLTCVRIFLGGCALVGVIVFASMKLDGHFHYSFGLCIVGGIGGVFSGIIFILAWHWVKDYEGMWGSNCIDVFSVNLLERTFFYKCIFFMSLNLKQSLQLLEKIKVMRNIACIRHFYADIKTSVSYLSPLCRLFVRPFISVSSSSSDYNLFG